MKYLLSTGNTTSKVEEYALDLIRIFLHVYPNDIPGNSNLGFNFNLSELPKYDLVSDIKHRMKQLIELVKTALPSTVELELTDVKIYNESMANVVITVSGKESQTFEISI